MSRASLRQIAALLLLVAPAHEGVVGEGVLHVDDHGRRGVHRGQLFHRQHALEEVAALAAVFFGDFDAHQAELEQFLQQIFAEHAGFVHLAHVGADALAREAAHGGAGTSFLLRSGP